MYFTGVTFVSDLKMLAILIGNHGNASMHNCPYCEGFFLMILFVKVNAIFVQVLKCTMAVETAMLAGG